MLSVENRTNTSSVSTVCSFCIVPVENKTRAPGVWVACCHTGHIGDILNAGVRLMDPVFSQGVVFCFRHSLLPLMHYVQGVGIIPNIINSKLNISLHLPPRYNAHACGCRTKSERPVLASSSAPPR